MLQGLASLVQGAGYWCWAHVLVWLSKGGRTGPAWKRCPGLLPSRSVGLPRCLGLVGSARSAFALRTSRGENEKAPGIAAAGLGVRGRRRILQTDASPCANAHDAVVIHMSLRTVKRFLIMARPSMMSAANPSLLQPSAMQTLVGPDRTM